MLIQVASGDSLNDGSPLVTSKPQEQDGKLQLLWVRGELRCLAGSLAAFKHSDVWQECMGGSRKHLFEQQEA
ncbi:uncharacterized [Tachysurus ichikawai]